MKKTIKRTVFIGFKYPHHSQHSGYDHIAEYLGYDLVLHAGRFRFFRTFHHLAANSSPFKISKYTLLDPLALFYKTFRVFAFLRTFLMRNTVFHFAYPETGICFTRTLFTKTNRFVASVHLPSDSLHRLHPRIVGKLRRMDHLITMADDLPDLARVVSTTHIPHGVDTGYFAPVPEKERDIDIIMLGNWLRNFELAKKVFQELQSRGDYSIKVIAREESLNKLKNLDNVDCHSDIPDHELLDYLQRSKVLFLPLHGLTANNALLEAAACGCRICLSLPPGVSPSYFQGHLDILPDNSADCAGQLSVILKSPFDRNELRTYTLQEYRWEVIAQKTLLILLSPGL